MTDNEIEVESLEGEEAQDVIETALRDPEVEELVGVFRDLGWSLQLDNARVSLTKLDGNRENYHSVILPLGSNSPGVRRTRSHRVRHESSDSDKEDESEQAFIVWTEHEALDTAGHWLRRSGIEQWTETVFTVEGGSVVEETQKLEGSFGQSPDQVHAQHHFPCGVGKSVNWDCVKEVAAQYAVIIGACGTCAETNSVYACSSCVGAVYKEYSIDCNLCT